jgi:DNA-binding GntR family transcriptional regulator
VSRREPLPVDDAPLVEAVYQRLLGDIVAGRLARGSVVSELAVARELGVSRTPVHDAVRQLAKDGLVSWEKGRRARVTAFTPDDVYDIFEVRKYLEGPAAELAAGRADRRHLVPLREAADALLADRRDPDWTARWADFDEDFHRTIAVASGNRRLAQEVNRYRVIHKAINRLATDPDMLQVAMAEHLTILEALEARDGPRARDRMVAHITTWQDVFMRRVPWADGSDPDPRPG